MSSLVRVNGEQISINVSSVLEAKLAIKELKLLKRGYVQKKKKVVGDIRAIKFDHTQEVRSRGSMLRGGGVIGRFVRGVQSIARDKRTAKLATDLHPYEVEKSQIENAVNTIDGLILKLEVYIHDAG